jgi:ABC-2 type transport system permease protein
MIRGNVIKAILLRYFYVWKSDYNTMLASLYWPLLDILIWGFLGSWIEQSGNQGLANYQFVALLGILLWQVVGRGSNIILAAFNEELWSNNIVNLFSLPVRLSEYILAITIFYITMILFTNLVCMVIIPLLYPISFFVILSSFLTFFLPFLLCGMWLGFIALAILVTFGKRGTEIAYIVSWFLLPFSGAYYPITVLPSWAQKFSLCFPMSYLSEAVREYYLHNTLLINNIIIGSVLALFYLILGVSCFVHCFNASKKKGLSRLIE